MLPTWFCIFSSRPFEATFENAQWRKVQQMQTLTFLLVCFRTNQSEEIICKEVKVIFINFFTDFFNFFQHCVICVFKCIMTLVAFVGLFSTVRVEMSPQIACLSRGKVILVTFVWLFSTVCFQMFPQIACPRRSIVTFRLFSPSSSPSQASHPLLT